MKTRCALATLVVLALASRLATAQTATWAAREQVNEGTAGCSAAWIGWMNATLCVLWLEGDYPGSLRIRQYNTVAWGASRTLAAFMMYEPITDVSLYGRNNLEACVVWRQANAIRMRRTFDGGESWRPEQILGVGSSPTVAFTGPNSVVAAWLSAGDVVMIESTNSGQDWTGVPGPLDGTATATELRSVEVGNITTLGWVAGGEVWMVSVPVAGDPWNAPERVSAPSAGAASLALGGDGRIVAAWTQVPGLYYSQSATDRTWNASNPVALSTGITDAPRITTAWSQATIVWMEDGVLRYHVRSTTNEWSPAEGSLGAALEATALGTAVAWVGEGGEILMWDGSPVTLVIQGGRPDVPFGVLLTGFGSMREAVWLQGEGGSTRVFWSWQYAASADAVDSRSRLGCASAASGHGSPLLFTTVLLPFLLAARARRRGLLGSAGPVRKGPQRRFMSGC